VTFNELATLRMGSQKTFRRMYMAMLAIAEAVPESLEENRNVTMRDLLRLGWMNEDASAWEHAVRRDAVDPPNPKQNTEEEESCQSDL
jgi:hypothetical protein